MQMNRSWNVYLHSHWLGCVWADTRDEAARQSRLKFGTHAADLFWIDAS